jgi:hypothetical protein
MRGEEGEGGCGPAESFGSRFSLTEVMFSVWGTRWIDPSCCGVETFRADDSGCEGWRAWDEEVTVAMGRRSSGFLEDVSRVRKCQTGIQLTVLLR